MLIRLNVEASSSSSWSFLVWTTHTAPSKRRRSSRFLHFFSARFFWNHGTFRQLVTVTLSGFRMHHRWTLMDDVRTVRMMHSVSFDSTWRFVDDAFFRGRMEFAHCARSHTQNLNSSSKGHKLRRIGPKKKVERTAELSGMSPYCSQQKQVYVQHATCNMYHQDGILGHRAPAREKASETF